MGACHHVTPPLLKKIFIRPPGKNFMGAYHHITPPLLKEIFLTADLT